MATVSPSVNRSGIRLEKKDLYMFLARLMEESPECHAPSDEKDQKQIVEELKKNFDYHEWKQTKCETQPKSVPSDSEENGGTEGMNDEGPLAPYLKKEDLCMFLALHMENSPSESQKPPYTTGIVVCEASKPKRIIALGCSTEELHAVPKVLLRFPNALKGCEVYMSRMPCNNCATLLVQAQVSQVNYWPNFESEMTKRESLNDSVKHAQTIFTESYVVAAPNVPKIDSQKEMQILNSNKGVFSDDNLSPVTSVFDVTTMDIDGNILKYLNLEHLKKCQQKKDQLEEYKKNLTTAKNCFQTLARCKDEKIIILKLEEKKYIEMNNPKYTHAIQLCDLLASRSDNNNGVGTVIYKEDNIVALGYSGYPKGAMNSLFYKKADVDFDKHAVVCAEANSIIMSSERDLSNAELITTREPCDECLKLIWAKKTARVIWPLRKGNVGGVREG
ncbi:PREDICTED: cytidine and dCMP deaminase domain-containing protein 1-like [Lepidothrix coronata]|uniref:dCMP deaminase n=1 Tax=Lepidothrix coronata TaxID=321398 RepID=A0A6J0GFE0_9PASS|nr:PREDICTED: cytidine and dCMP deaminase domain-containing protein 1-like [Lepidothrix coronata]